MTNCLSRFPPFVVKTSASNRATRFGTTLLLLAALGLWAAAARAQAIVPNFNITNGQVSAQVLRGNTLYVGGSFSFVGPVTGAGVPVDQASGLPLAGFPRVNGTVLTA